MIKIATIKTLNNGESGLSFRTNINDNFANLNEELKNHDSSISSLDEDVKKHTDDIQTLHSLAGNLEGGYKNIFVTSLNSSTGTKQLPLSSNDSSVTLVGNEHFEQTTSELNNALQNSIKGEYLKAGAGIKLVKSASGVEISTDGSTSGNTVNHSWQHSNPNLLINWDWRHPSCHRGNYTFIKNDDEIETLAKPCIDCWEINYSNVKGVGYTFYDAEEGHYVAYQGTSPTDNGDLSTYATISQSFPDDWGDFLVGKKLTFSVAVSDSYSEYQNNEFYIYSYTFTARQGYTGWMQFPYPSQLQFGIHFNTELDGHIENEITLRFNNIWVWALKLEIGETETLSSDLKQPVDCYGQARECEKYIQSVRLDGISESSMAPLNLNFNGFFKNDSTYIFHIPISTPFYNSEKVKMELYENGILSKDASIQLTYHNGDSLVYMFDAKGSINVYPQYIEITCVVPEEEINTSIPDKSTIKYVYATIPSQLNIVFSCEETYNS